VNPADPNLVLLELIAAALGPLRERFVFVGGCTTGMLVTDVAAAPVRATRDVDVIVEVLTLADYHALERELEKAGFRHDRSPEAPICRWIVGTSLLDVMPTGERVLGFANRWITQASHTAESVKLPSGQMIKLRAYIAHEIDVLLRNSEFNQALPGHLAGDETSQARIPLIKERLRQLSLAA
jgi:hypothetical protein